MDCTGSVKQMTESVVMLQETSNWNFHMFKCGFQVQKSSMPCLLDKTKKIWWATGCELESLYEI